MSTWVVPIVVCFLVGAFSFFMGRWSRRSNTKAGAPSTSTNSDYAALAQAWRKLADESSDARYSAHLYGCAEDLCQLNSAKAPNSHFAATV
jgi:Zn-dependent protease with chaperone function